MTDDWTQVWRGARVCASRSVGRGARLLEVELPDALPFPYQPGHVVVLREGGHRHPYTVCAADPARRVLSFLFRVVPGGRLTPTLATVAPGHPLELNGLHHTPILGDLAPAATAVVGLATGSGIGPLWGFAAQALAQGFTRPITLFAGCREEEDLCLGPELDALQAAHPTFRWHPTLTQPGPAWTGLRGRVGESAPPLIPAPLGCHYHLVGNGGMLVELKAALRLVGVPEAQVTSEVFFNFNAEADPERVRAIAARFGTFR